jgi:hypothetical protein
MITLAQRILIHPRCPERLAGVRSAMEGYCDCDESPSSMLTLPALMKAQSVQLYQYATLFEAGARCQS